jgi:hypothetical protein
MKHFCCILIPWLALTIAINAWATPPDKEAPDQKKAGSDLVTKGAQKAIDTGLAYLVEKQADDGSFGTGQYAGNVAVTGLAGLALLSSKPAPDGAQGKAVTKAVRYILSNEDANVPGFFTSAKGAFHGPMYGHGFALLFLADAYATTTDKKLKADIKDALERGVKLTIACQNNEGGWRYQPRPQDADLSVTAGQVLALRAARDAGFDVQPATLAKAAAYI